MRSTLLRNTGRRGGLTLLALVAVITGLVMVVVAVQGQRSVPAVPASAAGTLRPAGLPVPAPGGAATSTRRFRPTVSGANAKRPLSRSLPVSLSIPAIRVRTRVFSLGKADDGTLAVPQPGPNLNEAAWFNQSPTPGQPGPSIIEGHVDTDRGPSVFFELGDVRPGDTLRVTLRDRTSVVFTVDAVRDFHKDAFPTALVYGGGDLATPQLRLITCSDFDPSIGHHIGNAVVFAHLTGTHRQR